MLVLLFDAVIILYSLRGEREVAAKEFFLGALTTVLAEDEIVIRVEFPGSTQEMSGAFHEVSRRPGDFAMAAAGVLLSACDGVVTSSKVALMGVSETPIRSDIAESLLTGSRLTLEKIKSISNEVSESLTPRTDLHASLDYRKHLASVVLERAISSAWDDAINSKNSRTMT
jgi:carbon-monoxide dehydrogenase medium subunit